MEIKFIQTQKVLSPTQIKLADYVINPYRGCEFGCLYCYANENKNIKGSSIPVLSVKINSPEILEKELRLKKPKQVLLGSTTECFQYKDSQYLISPKILAILNANHIPYTILTKSHLISRHLDLIKQNPENKIYFTFNASDDKLIHLLEKKSPGINQRLEAINAILEAGIGFRLHIGPFIPYVCDIKKIFKLLPQKIKEIDVELYHHKMGNFQEILSRVKQNFNQKIFDNLKKTYTNNQNYQQFAFDLKKTLKSLNTDPGQKIYYLVPDYNEFYNLKMNYENTLL